MFLCIFLTIIHNTILYPEHLKGNTITIQLNPSSTDKTQNIPDCACKLIDNQCNYHCCCDSNCESSIRENWKDQNLCIDEINSLNKIPYTCIDKKYFIFKMNKNKAIRKRRGFEIRNDINDNDYCFQVDNSGYETERYSSKLYDEILNNYTYMNLIFEKYVEKDILNLNSIKTITPDAYNGKNYVIYAEDEENNNNPFIYDNMFIVYTPDLNGNCVPTPVQFYKRISQKKCTLNSIENFTFQNVQKLKFITCSNFEENTNENINTNTDIEDEENENNCFPGLNPIQPPKDNSLFFKLLEDNKKIEPSKLKLNEESLKYIVEIEFIIRINEENQVIESVSYNGIYKENQNDNNDIIFNVRFIGNDEKEGFLISGRGGYKLGEPLIILSDNNELNYYGFYIKCVPDRLYDILNDKPILFGEDFIYSCPNDPNADDSDLNLTKINSISAIGIYGNSYDNSNDYIALDKSSNFNPLDKNYILRIYVDNVGPSSYPRYRVIKAILNSNNNESFTPYFQVKYYFLKNGINVKNKGSVLPKMPKDLIQPFIELDV